MSTRFEIPLCDPDKTAAFARRLGALLGPGDVILLEGPIGAGKTHFARSLIQSLLMIPEDVPSPTFTLVQTYETAACEIWHSDLYRLSDPQEIEELGLIDAFDTAICLIEWPDRLGSFAPKSALHLGFTSGPGDLDRTIIATAPTPIWQTRMKEITK
ncbi:unnamed protein product [Cyprideis torosa]|uniref:tRNA threonylcarbamoyladenosine biosynthesis protein TsaE n=1 Tax=Cyprideis torosa TaxID=163714 RepID=A0A7R8WUX9_9CRUS|nr:unnamed protein product [Cyprideis torosa]CAG0910915.1 unnamed protein product [Cyprideis torosa]